MIKESLDIAIKLCKHFEGFSSKPYIDPVGVPTIGYGTVYKPDGSKVTLEHPPISEEVAEEWLVTELKHNYMIGVLKHSPHLVNHPEALGALSDFAYNLGVSRYRASTLARRVNEQDWEGARKEIVKWNRGGGRILPGLVRRRLAELEFLHE